MTECRCCHPALGIVSSGGKHGCSVRALVDGRSAASKNCGFDTWIRPTKRLYQETINQLADRWTVMLEERDHISDTPLRTVSIDDLKAYIDPQNRGFL
jgi:hypothetical protein